jgi:hypothetical protein
VASSPARVAACLDGLDSRRFLVQAAGTSVLGSSPGGVAFTIRIYPSTAAARSTARRSRGPATRRFGNAILDWSGNPRPPAGGAPAALTTSDLRAVRACLFAP